MSFLKAEWRNLALANYRIEPGLLAEFVPAGTELDLWNGTCYVSLVGFMFLNTRILGIKVPFHVNFEEVNLRFYVRRRIGDQWKRGVVFIREIVPKPALTLVANTIYGENYETLPMRHHWGVDNSYRIFSYEWKKGGSWQSIEVRTANNSIPLQQGTETAFITEHYWGYARVNDLETNEYEVTHPAWNTYPVQDYAIDVDFSKVYGRKFSVLNKQEPVSVMLAEGSGITVEAKSTLDLRSH